MSITHRRPNPIVAQRHHTRPIISPPKPRPHDQYGFLAYQVELSHRDSVSGLATTPKWLSASLMGSCQPLWPAQAQANFVACVPQCWAMVMLPASQGVAYWVQGMLATQPKGNTCGRKAGPLASACMTAQATRCLRAFRSNGQPFWTDGQTLGLMASPLDSWPLVVHSSCLRHCLRARHTVNPPVGGQKD